MKKYYRTPSVKVLFLLEKDVVLLSTSNSIGDSSSALIDGDNGWEEEEENWKH